MLIHRTETFHHNGSDVDGLRLRLKSHYDMLVRDSLLCRTGHTFVENRSNATFAIGGILTFDDRPPQDMNALAPLADTTSLVERHVDTTSVPFADDETLCMHDRWTSLELVGEPLIGLPSLVCCECRGRVAPHRLSLQPATRVSLWRWERQFDAVYACWLASAEYETWAQSQLHDARSPLNVLGETLTQAIHDETGVIVSYPAFFVR
jgi:hypothetical protein